MRAHPVPDPRRPRPGARERLADRLGDGASRDAFARTDWVLLWSVSVIFGSAFLWIALALRSLAPGVVAVGRLALGAGSLALLPGVRRRIDRADWAIVAGAGLVGQGAPAYLFAAAEQHISSALTGMLVAGVPVLAAVISALITRRPPGRWQVAGLAAGLGGIALMAGPDLGRGGSTLGVSLVLVAVLGYAVSTNLYPRVVQTYGSLPVTMWGQAISAVVLLPLGVASLGDSSAQALPIAALVVLGVIGTGLARALLVTLVGRVGPRRAPVISYVIPIVALVLGVAVLDESIDPIQVVGVAVALAGGFLVTRAE